MISVDLETLVLLAVGAFVLAAPTEYRVVAGAGALGMRLLAWAAGAALVALPIVAASSEQMCPTLGEAWAGNCAEFGQIYFSLLPIVAGLSLVLWSVL